MKKVDSFSGIPAVPTSIAGQWLAFSHMANHYRKLLNVKPRVNSSAPLRAPSTAPPQSSPYLKRILPPPPPPPRKANKGPPCCCASSPITARKHATTPIPIKANKRPREHPPDNLHHHQSYTCKTIHQDHEYVTEESHKKSKKQLSNKSIKNKTNMMTMKTCSESHCSSNYHMLYGPSSMKSSTDALVSVSDCESSCPEEPRVQLETMGVAEKIKVFLDNLHHFDSSPVTAKPPRKSNPPNRKQFVSCCSRCGAPATAKKKQAEPSTSEAVPVLTRESRHVNCFIPVKSPSETPQKITSAKNQTKTNRTIPLSEVIAKNKTTKVVTAKNTFNTMTATTAGTKLKQKMSTDDKIQSFGSGVGSVLNDKKKRYLSGASSVGTIRGSEELATEIIHIMPPKPTKYDHQLPTKDKSSRPRTQESSRTRVQEKSSRTRTPSAGYCSQSASGKATATSMSSIGGIIRIPKNNNDSSRDSAYGFSSGESRITTRDSTPEKLTAFNKDSSSPLVKNRVVKRSSERERHKSTLSTVASSVVNFGSSSGGTVKEKKSTKSRLTTEDKYLNFLTEVTDDIVNRGIYTNRGLKMLFKAHLEQQTELNVDRMTEMLERLRMDLGIPKDDNLNKLEFGYGSVINTSKKGKSSTANFPTRPKLIPNSFQYPKASQRTCGLDEAFSDEFLAPPQPHPSYNPLILPNRDSESEMEIHSCKSETSLSETELQRTLKEVGIDSRTTLEIVGMIKHNGHDCFPVKKGVLLSGSSDENDNQQPLITNNQPSQSRSTSTRPSSTISS